MRHPQKGSHARGDKGAGVLIQSSPEGTRAANATGWLRGLEVTADGTGIVSHAGVALLRALADNTGLTAGLSRALASDRLLVHDRGRVLADLACAIADGAEVISDFRVMADQEESVRAGRLGADLLAGAG